MRRREMPHESGMGKPDSGVSYDLPTFMHHFVISVMSRTEIRHRIPDSRINTLVFCCLALFGMGGSTVAFAGGGSENLFLVVNPRSWASMTVANHYSDWRQIPPSHVFYLDWNSWTDTVSLPTFRERILQPIFEEIRDRGLEQRIDYVVYSCDFPFRVDLAGEYPELSRLPAVGRYASLNGLTYLHELVMRGDPGFVSPSANRYSRLPYRPESPIESRHFRQWYGWNRSGERLELGGTRYMLSTMLGVTHGRGNSVKEILRYLGGGVTADGTPAEGTMYYVTNRDIRTRRRRWPRGSQTDQFRAAVADLQAAGVSSEIVKGTTPRNAPRVAGAMLGTPRFDWEYANSRIIPGAICENFTSFGGDLSESPASAGQTPLSEFLRYGAAGSSGTVEEPLDFQSKFPLASLQVHYARGYSLAEAFYLSVQSPYQLLIVGDALAQPWAVMPQVHLQDIEPGDTVSGNIFITPESPLGGGPRVARWHLWIDGRHAEECLPGEAFEVDTRRLADGYHEFRVVGHVGQEVATQGRIIIPLEIDNHSRQVTLEAASGSQLRHGDVLKITVTSPGADSLELRQGARLLKRTAGGQAEFAVPTSSLGQGPVRLHAVARHRGQVIPWATSSPLELEILPAATWPIFGSGPGGLKPGIQLTLGSRPISVKETIRPDWFAEAGAIPSQDFSILGYFEVPEADTYQFHVVFSGDLAVHVDGREIYRVRDRRFETAFLPVPLGEGTHELRIRGRTLSNGFGSPDRPPLLHVGFGGAGVRAIGAPVFSHP